MNDLVDKVASGIAQSRVRLRRVGAHAYGILLFAAYLALFWKSFIGAESRSFDFVIGLNDQALSPSPHPVPEGALCDPSIYQFHIPNAFFSFAQWSSLKAPLWNPYAGCGAPFLANIAHQALSPWRLLFPYDQHYLYNLGIVLQPLLAAIGMFLLCRRIGVRKAASYFAATAFAFCPYFMVYLERPHNFFGMPWLTLAAFVACRTPSPASICVAAFASTLMIFATHVEPAAYFLAASLSVGGLLSLSRHKLQPQMRKVFLVIAAISIVALLLAMIQIVPFIELLKHGTSYKTTMEERLHLHPLIALFNLVSPAMGPGSLFVGSFSVPLVVAATLHSCVRWRSVFIFLLMFISMTVDNPLARLLYSLPGLSWFQPFYGYPAVLFMLCLMSARGFDLLAAATRLKAASAVQFFAFGTVCMLLAVLFAGSIPDRLFLETNVPSLHVPIRFQVMMVLASLLLAICAISLRGRPVLIRFLMPVLFVFNSAGLVFYCRNALPSNPPFELRLPAAAHQLLGENRFCGLGTLTFMPALGTLLSVRDAANFDVIEVERYSKLCTALGGTWLNVAQIYYKQPLPQFAPLFACERMIKPMAVVDWSPTAAWHKSGKFFSGAQIYKNDMGIARFQICYRARNVSNESEALKALTAPAFEPVHEVVLEEGPWPTEFAPATGKISVLNDEPGRINLRVATVNGGYLVVRDSFYPGWKAELDNKRTRILRANSLFRAVLLPPGEHQVVMYFRPASFIIGSVISGVTAVLSVCLIVFRRRHRKIVAKSN